MVKKKRLLLLIFSIMLLIMSCGSSNNSKTDGKVVTFNMEAEPTSLDPQLLTDAGAFMITGLTAEGLVRLDDKNEIIPAGAESWTVSDDGTVWTFKIREGMKWSNGDPLTAKDYYLGWKRGLDPETAAEYAFMMYYIKGAEDYNVGNTDDFETVGIKLVDDYTLEVTLEKPAAYFVKTLVLPIFYPLNANAIEEFGEGYATSPEKAYYSGPYIMTGWTQGTKIELEKNQNYWDADNIKLDKIVAVMVSDYDAATNSYENDELDLTKISIEKISNYRDSPELKSVANGRVYYFAFNPDVPVLRNKKVRQALSLAIDKNAVANDILNGGGIPATGIVADGFAGVNGDFRKENGDLYLEYQNLDLNALFEEGLAELGITKDDVKLTLTVDDKGSGRKEAEFYQNEWQEKLGIHVDIIVKEYKDRIASAKQGDYEIIRYAWGPDYADAMTYLEIFTQASSMNVAKYVNNNYDSLINDGQINQNEEERIKSMQRAEKIWADDFYYFPLYYEVAMFLQRDNVDGIVLRSVGNPVDLRDAYLK